MKLPIPLLVAGLVTACLHAQSPYSALQVPKQIQYQGRVATGTGAAWSGTEGYFAFALVQGATVLWNNWEGTASPSDPGAVSLGAGQVLTLPVDRGVFSLRVGEGTDTNEQIPPTVFFDTVSNSVRNGVKLAVWFSPDGGNFTRLGPDVEFTSTPYSMVSGIAEALKERAVTTAMLADGQVTSEKLGSNLLLAGNVGIGTATPSGKLDVAGGAYLGGVSNANRFFFTGNQIQQYNNGAPADMFLNHSGGNVYAMQKPVTVGEENLRIVRGTVNSNGTIAAGTGFTVVRSSPGVYDIQMITKFSSEPSVTVTIKSFNGVEKSTYSITGSPNFNITVVSHVWGNASYGVDNAFSFIAIGPR